MQELLKFHAKFTKLLCKIYQNFMQNISKFYVSYTKFTVKLTKILCKIYQNLM